MSTPGFSIPNTTVAAAIPRSVRSVGGGGGGPGRSGSNLFQSEKLMLRGAYEWTMGRKSCAMFSPLTLTGAADGVYGMWVWRNPRGLSIKLTTPMGHRSSLITCYRSEVDEIFSGVWNRVLGEWNDVTFNKPVTRGWLFTEFGIASSKPFFQVMLQRLRIGGKALRRRVRTLGRHSIAMHR